MKTKKLDILDMKLGDLFMIKKTIKKYSGEYTKTELWKVLSKKMIYSSFKIIIDYLIKSKKVVIKNNKVVYLTQTNEEYKGEHNGNNKN